MAPKLPKILIVDDEPQIRRFLRASLPPHGYDHIEAENSFRGAQDVRARKARRGHPRSRPSRSGRFCGDPADIRKTSGLTPIVVLGRRVATSKARCAACWRWARTTIVTKPFDMSELLARLKAALRHGLQSGGETPVFQTGKLKIDLVNRRVTLGESEVHLSPKEYNLLRFLAAHVGKVVTHQQLLREVWGPAHLEDVQYLRVLMRQLRQKLEPKGEPNLLVTEPAIGYRLLVLP